MITFLGLKFTICSIRRRKKSGPFLHIDNSMFQSRCGGVLNFHCPAFGSCRQSQCIVFFVLFYLKANPKKHYKLETGTLEGARM